MTVDQLPKPKAIPRGDTKLVKYEEYIDRQVESTRRVVKIVDLATSLVVLAAGALAFLLVVAVVEHWLIPGGFSTLGRAALLALLAFGAGSFVVRRLWPLVIGRVNPIYAANAIEVAAETGPSLKNSLVNLLLFRQKRSEISDAVYHTLEEQAAQRLSRVPLDSAVDRTTLIRFGYLLVAIVAVAALYKVFSPKDPIVAARRVLMPWAHIVPASRVQILDVKPGVTTVSRGEFVDVSAEVRGVDDNVLLRFTMADGQAVDKSVLMKRPQNKLRHEGRLPIEEVAGGEFGLSQDVTYRIEAGDARTLDYAVTVVESPSILVERIEYDYPEYTGYVDREVKVLGDISAIEGTRITVHARANGPIQEAHVDFDADGRRELTMTSRDANATASFVLALREDRRTPEHASYVLRFANRDGRPNRNPVKHSIDVKPDYSPEAAILAPREKLLDVRLDETVAVEVEARDPDFALADVRLRGQVQARDALDVPLLKLGHQGRFSTRYQFTPSAHGLKAGDVVEYWVAANDNRAPKPNTAESIRQQFRIVSPDPRQQPPANNQQGKGQKGEQQPQDGKAGQGDQQGEQKQREGGGQSQPGENQQPQQGGEGQKGDSEQKGQPQNDNQSNGDAQQSEQPRGGEQETDSKEDSSGAQQGEKGENRPSDANQDSKQTGAGAAGGEPSQGATPDGTRPDDNTNAKPSDGKGQNAKQQQGEKQPGEQQTPSAEPSPVSSEGDNDAEAFDRIQQHMKRTGDMKEDESAPDENKFSRDALRSATQQQKEGEKGSEGEAGSEQKSEAKQEQRGEKNDSRQSQGANQEGQKVDDREGAGEEAKGAETKAGDAQPDQEKAGEKNQQTESPGGQQTSTKGESGAGNEQKSQARPNSNPDMKPAEKREQQGSKAEESKGEEPPAGARGKKESDSQGEQGGDRAGGGDEGGGQKAPRDGTGSAGQNQSADEGAGESSEKGAGNNSPNAGTDAKAGSKTGQSSEDATGRGSKTREVGDVKPEAGEKTDPAQKNGQPLHHEPPKSEDSKAAKDGERSEKGGDKPPAGGEDQDQNAQQDAPQTGAPTGSGGEQGTAAMAPPRSTGTAPEGDQANLDYARKRTDLVLEKLSEQMKRQKVDKDMLKKLGWSEDDLRKFVDRWQERKQAAARTDDSGDAAKRELDEALRSLGLRRGSLKQRQVKDDSMRDLHEGYRGPVPLEYQERLRAYNQGVSRARTEANDE